MGLIELLGREALIKSRCNCVITVEKCQAVIREKRKRHFPPSRLESYHTSGADIKTIQKTKHMWCYFWKNKRWWSQTREGMQPLHAFIRSEDKSTDSKFNSIRYFQTFYKILGHHFCILFWNTNLCFLPKTSHIDKTLKG